ncbi:LRR receptor-like serine/threonine-protein kinase ERL1 [Prunus yedoensis var. nudiflora]|uniref:LRR receptor-like serine/threonine-protein kinase ERL1 n=1 Tax=Prunus yedoensis var. nudiflora TaxID=2094558 RepID=A0A314UM50_PRUYE|nr:LRR receptor-like serine/threonine-protein kinase ERL1 [Prunus yedoensis var. nudiflora]
MDQQKLTSTNLRTFPDFLRNQYRLSYLDLSSGNQIHGEVPNWIWRLNLLEDLNTSGNSLVGLEGPLPNLTSALSLLELHSNQLRGQITILWIDRMSGDPWHPANASNHRLSSQQFQWGNTRKIFENMAGNAGKPR